MINIGTNLSPHIKNAICFQMLLMLCTPFEQFPAYKAGVIDQNGKYLIPRNKRSTQQNKTVSYLDRLIINVKKIINKLPGGQNKLKNIVSAMVLVKQSYDNNVCPQNITKQSFDNVMDSFNTGQTRYQEMIDLWLRYLKDQRKRTEQVGVSAISSGGQPNGEAPTNNTSGVSFNSMPIGYIARRQQIRYKNDANNQFIINTEK